MAKVNITDPSAAQQEVEWAEIYLQMLALVDRSLPKLQSMLSNSNVPNIIQLRKEIEAIEEQGDDVKMPGSINSTQRLLECIFSIFTITVKCCINPMIS